MATRSRTATTWGTKRVHIASIANSPDARAACTTSRASAEVMVKAFSTRTGLPWARASRALAWCIGWGVAT